MAGAGRLGKYRLDARLAVGGMAEVFVATAEGVGGFEKRVVVKRLLPQHARDPDVRAMFLDEARLSARLRHPNVAEVYDVGQDDKSFYFAMEYVVGTDLREVLSASDEPLPLDLALHIVAAVARGLHHAHELSDENGHPLSLVHRDVTPSNVLLGVGGEIKLTDFGVAKWTAQRSLTRQGTLKGKCAYMSPEQCQGQTLDRRSDVFALGVLLYETLTGGKPFDGDNDFAIMQAIVAGAYVPVRTRRPEISKTLESVVDKALAARPEHRFATAGDFAEAVIAQTRTAFEASSLAALLAARFPDGFLTPLAEGVTGSTSEPRKRAVTATDHATAEAVAKKRRPRVVLGSVLAAGLLLAVVWWQWGMTSARETVEARPAHASMEATGIAVVARPSIEARTKTETLDAGFAPSLSPSSSFLPSFQVEDSAPARTDSPARARKKPAASPRERAVRASEPRWDPDSPLPP